MPDQMLPVRGPRGVDEEIRARLRDLSADLVDAHCVRLAVDPYARFGERFARMAQELRDPGTRAHPSPRHGTQHARAEDGERDDPERGAPGENIRRHGGNSLDAADARGQAGT